MGDAEKKRRLERGQKALKTLDDIGALSGEVITFLETLGKLKPGQRKKMTEVFTKEVNAFFASMKSYTLRGVAFNAYKKRFGLKQEGKNLIAKDGKTVVATFGKLPRTDFGAARYSVAPINPTPVMTRWLDTNSIKPKTTQPARRKGGGALMEM